MDTMNALRRAADNGPLRSVLLDPRVRGTAARVASVRFLRGLAYLDHPVDFLSQMFSARQPVVLVGLRHSDIQLALRADPGSLELLYELFVRDCYLPRSGVETEGWRVLDVGANSGVFAAYALSRLKAGSVTCIEPDPENLLALNAFAEVAGSARITLIAAAAANFSGEVTFVAGSNAGSRIAEGGTPTPAIDFFDIAAGYDYIKMDIEGGEWAILADPRMADLRGVEFAMEYHRRFPGDTGAYPEAKRLLLEAGFTILGSEPNHWGHGLIWARKP